MLILISTLTTLVLNLGYVVALFMSGERVFMRHERRPRSDQMEQEVPPGSIDEKTKLKEQPEPEEAISSRLNQ